MIIIVIALLTGLALGALSYYHPEVVFCLGGTAILSGLILAVYLTQYSGILEKLGHGEGRPWSVYVVIYQNMSAPLQASLFVFPAACVAGRCGAWMRRVHVIENAIPETAAQRKARIRAEMDFTP